MKENFGELADFLPGLMDYLCRCSPNAVFFRSMVELHRNVAGAKFPGASQGRELAQVGVKLVELLQASACPAKFDFEWCDQFDDLEIELLWALDLPVGTGRTAGAALGYAAEEELVALVNGQDHLVIVAFGEACKLQKALKRALAVTEYLEGEVEFAFDSALGFLTSQSALVGTGLRASCAGVLGGLFALGRLPDGLEESPDKGDRLIAWPQNRRGGDFYLVQNARTLGKSEVELVEEIEARCKALDAREAEAREQLEASERPSYEDRIFRAYGILKHCRELGSEEALELLSELALGFGSSERQLVEPDEWCRLIFKTSDEYLDYQAGEVLSETERNWRRAELVRAAL